MLCDEDELVAGLNPDQADTDGDGYIDSMDQNPKEASNQPPEIQLLNQANAFVRGKTIALRWRLLDDLGLSQLKVTINGTETLYNISGTDEQQVIFVPIAADATQLVLSAVVTDTQGQSASFAEQTFAVSDDPLTTLSGYVVDVAGLPIYNSTITIYERNQGKTYRVYTDRDGYYSLANLPSVEVSYRVSAYFYIQGYNYTFYAPDPAIFSGTESHVETIVFDTIYSTQDSDNDGLSYIAELYYGTDPNNADSDGDGFSDGFEINHSSDPLTISPELRELDSDQDGLTNYQEILAGTDPANPDSDNDGLTDGDEVMKYHTNALSQDTDGDGLQDSREILLMVTDPNAKDTDGDGLSDSLEYELGLSPVLSDTDNNSITDGYEYTNDILEPVTADPDGDGLSNLEEFQAGTAANRFDTDNDGLNDGDELRLHHTSPLLADTDGDGLLDLTEITMHKNANEFGDYPVIDSLLTPSWTPTAGIELTVDSLDWLASKATDADSNPDWRFRILPAQIEMTASNNIDESARIEQDTSGSYLQLQQPKQVWYQAKTLNYQVTVMKQIHFGDGFVRISQQLQSLVDEPVQIQLQQLGLVNQSNQNVRIYTYRLQGNSLVYNNDQLDGEDQVMIIGLPYATSGQRYLVQILNDGSQQLADSDLTKGNNGRNQWQTGYSFELQGRSEQQILQIFTTAETLEQALQKAEQYLKPESEVWKGLGGDWNILNFKKPDGLTAGVKLAKPARDQYLATETLVLQAEADLLNQVDFYINDEKVSEQIKMPYVLAVEMGEFKDSGSVSVEVRSAGASGGKWTVFVR